MELMTEVCIGDRNLGVINIQMVFKAKGRMQIEKRLALRTDPWSTTVLTVQGEESN